jgi:hypothetical protein
MLKWFSFLLFLSIFNFAQAQKSTFYFCGDCSPPAGKSDITGFFWGYYEMIQHKSKKEIIGVGSSMTPSFSIANYDLILPHERDKPSENKKLRVKMYNDIVGGKVPKAEKKEIKGTTSHEYKILNSLLEYENIKSNEKEKLLYEKIKTQGKGAHLRKDNMKEKLLIYLEKLDKSGPIVIHLAGHGWNDGYDGEGSLLPQDSGIALRLPGEGDTAKSTVLTHKELGEVLKKAGLAGPGAPPVRIVAEHCYGGGAHYLSETFPNICTSSFTSNKQPHWSAEELPVKFWRNYNSMTNLNGTTPSLRETFNSIIPDLGRNQGASLGSTQFVKNLLEKNGESVEKEVGLVPNWRRLLEGQKLWAPRCDELSVHHLPQIEDLKSIMNKISSSFEPYNKNYSDILSDLILKHKEYQRIISIYNDELQGMKEEWNRLKKEKKLTLDESVSDLQGWGYWMLGNFNDKKEEKLKALGEEEKKLLEKFEKIKKETLPTVHKYYTGLGIVKELLETEKFFDLHKSGKISKDDFDTYQRMLKCESLPL